MRILMIGDVVGDTGCEHLRKVLPNFKRQHNIDLVVVNGENSCQRNGITPQTAEHIFVSGADVITTGNHAFRRKECNNMFEEHPYLIRPANYPDSAYGKGMCFIDKGFLQICVINLMGRVYIDDRLKSPFECIDEMIDKAKSEGARIIIVDFHAEATAEKKALGYYVDGRVSAVVGTHTHIPTADAQILPKGTGYITDLGMTGAIDSVLGLKPEVSISWLTGQVSHGFYNVAEGKAQMDCVVIEVDDKTGKAVKIEQHLVR